MKWIECYECDGSTVVRPLSCIGYIAKHLYKGKEYFSFGIKDTVLKYGTPLEDKYGRNVYDDFIRFLEDETSMVFQVNGTFIRL